MTDLTVGVASKLIVNVIKITTGSSIDPVISEHVFHPPKCFINPRVDHGRANSSLVDFIESMEDRVRIQT